VASVRRAEAEVGEALPRAGTVDVGVRVRGVGKRFGPPGGVLALDDVSLDIAEGEFFTLLGPSGCGKTTLLRLIAGFEQPSAGMIALGGEDITHLPPFRRPVNTVFQSYALFPHMTVAGNVGFGLEMLGRPRAEVEATVARMLDLVRMGELAGRRVAQLSGGQQQRVALARALAPSPRVLLLDEPLSALDLKLRQQMQIELKRLQHETGITFVFVTHDQEEALTMSDRVAVMQAGRVLQVGAPREVYDRPARRFVADFIGEINVLDGELLELCAGHARVRLPGGAERSAGLPPAPVAPGPVHLAIRPERAALAAPSAETVLQGTVENVVYFGTGTNVHLELDDGTPFVVRLQHREGGERVNRVGERLGVAIGDGAFQVLCD
jgi:spermidine/putrescine transport system ATP-binding protein